MSSPFAYLCLFKECSCWRPLNGTVDEISRGAFPLDTNTILQTSGAGD